MKLGDFTGIKGIPNQDIAMWETMGPIADRTREKLGASDLAVVEFRKLMVDAARAFQQTGEVIGRAPSRTFRTPASHRSRQCCRRRRTGGRLRPARLMPRPVSRTRSPTRTEFLTNNKKRNSRDTSS